MDLSTLLVRITPRIILEVSHRKLFGRRDIEIFTRFLDSKKWKKVSDNPERWIFNRDNSFTIEISNDSREFVEPWVEQFPKGSRLVDVNLKINNELVCKPIKFVYVDEYRYLVPLTLKSTNGAEGSYFYWNMNSLEYAVFNIIGDVSYLYDSLEDFANANGVLITNV